MLHSEHHGQTHTKTALAGVVARPRGHEHVFRLLGATHEYSPSDGHDIAVIAHLGDSEEMTIDEFANRYLEARDELAFRKLSGEKLSAIQESILATLNRQLERILPNSEPLPDQVLDAMAEVERLTNR